MAPERFEGRGDARADVYALGLTLYELLTLQPGFSARDRLKLVEQMRTQEPPRPRSLDRRIPRDLETIVLKAMDRDAARRYQTAEELAQDLGRFLDDEPIHARQASVWERGWRWARRRPAVAGLFAALTVAAVALIAVAVTLYYNQKLDTLYQAAEKARGEAELARKDALQARDNEIRLRGLLAVRTGQFQDAIDDLSKLLPTDDRDVYVGLGQAYAGAGQPRQAVEHFSVALARDPEDVEARVGRAREYAKQRRHKEAADDYAAAFRIEPNLTEHAADYARALYEDAAWSDLEVIEMKSAGGATLTRSADNSILASGKNPAADVYTVAARTRLPHVAALRLELMARPNGRGAGRHLTRDTNGGWVMLGAFDLSAGPAPEGSALQPAPFEFAWSHFATSDQGNILNTISDERTTGWQWGSWLSASPTVSQSALFFLRQPLAHPRGTRLTVRLDFPTSDNQGQLAPDCFRLSATSRTDLMAFESMIARPQIDPWTKLAAAHCLRGDGAAALRALAKSAPKDANGFNALLTAVAQCQCEQWKEGRETLLRAFPQTLQMSDVQALLAVALSRLLQREPDDIELRLERARCYRRMGCWRPALADYERAQEIDPKDALILLEGGECRLRLGDAERAAADFEAAHRINPDACYAFHVTRAPTVKDVSGRDLACGLVHLKALCQAARGADTERGLLMRLAQLTERVTHYDDALAAYERLLELNPQDAKVLLLAAYVYRKRAETSALMGKHEEARQDWRRQQKFLEERLALHPDSATYAADLAQGLLAQTPRWTPVRPLEATAARDTPLTLLPDGSVLADSKASGDVYTLVADVDWKGVRGVKLEFLGHPRLSHGGPGRGWDGAFAPPDVELKIPRSSGHPSTAVLLSREPLVTGSLSGRWWEWAVYQTPPFADDAKGRTTILIHSAARQNPADIIGRCRLAVTADPQTVVSEQLQQSRLDGWLKLAAAHVLRGDRDAALAALRKGPAEQQPLNDVALAWVHLRIGKSDEARGAVIRVITLAKDWGDAKKRTGGDSPFDDPLIRALADGVFEKARAAGPDDKELLSLLREAEAAINGPKK
jgi:tetratricopeptide (TPR) repeat protein